MHWRGKARATGRPARRGREYSCPANRRWFIASQPTIINHQSSLVNPKAFTLIELLVVIAMIAMLMAILMPSLQRVRRQARAVACQANLGQWGIFYATYTADNNGYLPSIENRMPVDWASSLWVQGLVAPIAPLGLREGQSVTALKGILCCPMATKPAYLNLEQWCNLGGTFASWSAEFIAEPYLPSRYWCSSYTWNRQASSWWHNRFDPQVAPNWRFVWMTSTVKNAGAVPVLLDGIWEFVDLYDDKSPPPEYDAIPVRIPEYPNRPCEFVCINRHDGGVNSLFLDWSVRKVGLKELWTLKWHGLFDTGGPWTKRGGAKPEDWPQWMRRFKDY
jgi:prepilin-type N-terminal cleavage/methylation domain-containing protein/prepilin-type processing-associated H-X9-DG protein